MVQGFCVGSDINDISVLIMGEVFCDLKDLIF